MKIACLALNRETPQRSHPNPEMLLGCLASAFLAVFAGCASGMHSESRTTSAIEILAQPKDDLVYLGEVANFSVAANPPGVHYQWRLNGQPIAGETKSNLVLHAVNTNDIGSYDCVLSLNEQSLPTSQALLFGARINRSGWPLTLISYAQPMPTAGETIYCSAGTIAKLRFPTNKTVRRVGFGPWLVQDPQNPDARFNCTGNSAGSVECGTNSTTGYELKRWGGTVTYWFMIYLPVGSTVPTNGQRYDLNLDGFVL